MKRRQFIKYSSISSLVLLAIPQFALLNKEISIQELIGKGNPELLGKHYKLRKEAYFSFLKLQKAAKKEGIHINALSSYRSYAHQKRIWERKFNSNKLKGLSPTNNIKKIIEYSTIPGTSRHHWGTDIDIYQTNVSQPKKILQPENYHGNGSFCKLKQWMDNNAKYFGFYLVYTNNGNRKGFKYEPWHYSYKPLSSIYLKQYKTINIIKTLQNDNLSGSDFLSEVFINKYIKENILDINPELL